MHKSHLVVPLLAPIRVEKCVEKEARIKAIIRNDLRAGTKTVIGKKIGMKSGIAYGILVRILFGMLVMLTGCGGNIASTLSGGSVPIGGRVVSGTAVLPNTTPAANATVMVRTLASNTLLQTTTTDAQGHFSIDHVPTNQDILFVVLQPSGNQLQTVVLRTDLAANPTQPLNIGNITAITTVVAAAIKLEQERGPEDNDTIPGTQTPHLSHQAMGQNYSLETQNQMITDPNSLQAQALTLLVPTANTELETFVATPNTDTASTALNGLLSYVRCAHSHPLHLSSTLRNSIITAQLAGTQYSPDAIATALQAAGVSHVTATQVSAASQRERTSLTSLSSLSSPSSPSSPSSGITAFEALVIAADVNVNGGFQLDPNSLNVFLTHLLGP